MHKGAAGHDGDIQVRWVGDNILYGSSSAVHLTADHLDLVAAESVTSGFQMRSVLLARVHHFVRGGQVSPQLKACILPAGSPLGIS